MQVPYFDMEVIGIHPLRYVAQVAFMKMYVNILIASGIRAVEPISASAVSIVYYSSMFANASPVCTLPPVLLLIRWPMIIFCSRKSEEFNMLPFVLPILNTNRGEFKKMWKDFLTAPGQRFLIFGGKGGVGKTTSSASMAVLLADEVSISILAFILLYLPHISRSRNRQRYMILSFFSQTSSLMFMVTTIPMRVTGTLPWN